MILLALLATAGDVPPSAAPADDIVVIAAKLKKIRLSASSDGRGRVTACEVTASSGDAALDAYACQAARQCAGTGMNGGDRIADCVDEKMIAFVSKGQPGATEKRN